MIEKDIVTSKIKNMIEKDTVKPRIKNIIVSICTIVIISCIAAFALITVNLLSKEEFSYADSLNDTVLTVEKENISLKEISYYILVAETNYNEAANIYNEDNPHAFWNIALNMKYFRNRIKQSVIDACTRDNVYYQQALKEGYTLKEEELQEIRDKALEEISKMTDWQMKITDYQMSDMVNVLTKIAYSRKYAENLMAEGYTAQELDVDGSKYEEIKKDYAVSINQKIWKNITLGKVTINNEDAAR
ncbi:MAG: hypothetical protein K1W19_09920 [Lachnospiraceae bacterium]|nr:hypothetical protein [Lachnospiraceae bacterium]